jgi:hypothetical protein
MTKQKIETCSREAMEKELMEKLNKLSIEDLRTVLAAATQSEQMSDQDFAEWCRSISSR